MNYAAVLKGRIRALVSDAASLTVLIIISVLCVFISLSGNKTSKEAMPVGVVNEDTGVLGEELSRLLYEEEEYDFYPTEYDRAMKDIGAGKAHGLVVIRKDFSERIEKGEYESLLDVTVMADSYDITAFTEVVINDTIKIWMQSLIEKRFANLTEVTEEEFRTFQEKSIQVWSGESLLDVEAYPAETVADREEAEEEEDSFSGIRWYVALSLFYLMIGGTWMCDYGSGRLIKRVVGKGGNIALLFVFQSLPGLLVTLLGLIPVLIAESAGGNPFLILTAYLFYAVGACGMALTVCSLSGKFSNLVLVSPVITMAASLMSGLLFKLPDWAKFWETASFLLPGHYFHRAVSGDSFLIGAAVVGLIWFFVGMLTAWLLAKIRRK